MPLRDQKLRCTRCGTEFLFGAAELRRRLEAGEGRTPPALCPGCRVLQRLLAARLDEAPAGGPSENGCVKWYDRRKGFGFVTARSGEQVFFHRSSLARGYRAPRRGESVQFEWKAGERGTEAARVRLVDRDRSDQLAGNAADDSKEAETDAT